MYILCKFLHIISVVLFLGNITTGLFWHAHAVQARDPKLLAHVVAGIIRSDRIFTIPGVVVMTVTGIAAAVYGHLSILRTGWILWALVFLFVSGLIFMLRVAPLQKQLLALAEAGVQAERFDYADYQRLAVRWELLGAQALLMPVLSLMLMVFKPTL